MPSTLRWSRIRPVLLPLILAPIAVIVVVSTSLNPAEAQDVTGSLQGLVVSPEGKLEPDVHVTVSGPHLQGVRETATDRGGFYQFLALPPGTYTLRLGRVGSRPIEVREIVVELGRTTTIPTLTLTTQAIEMEPVSSGSEYSPLVGIENSPPAT